MGECELATVPVGSLTWTADGDMQIVISRQWLWLRMQKVDRQTMCLPTNRLFMALCRGFPQFVYTKRIFELAPLITDRRGSGGGAAVLPKREW